jgi:DNA-binding MarR family transcriptional regulator
LKNIYFKYLELCKHVDAATVSISKIDERAKKLLQLIAINHMHGMTLTVKTAMALSSIASSATIQRKLDDLYKAGLVDKVLDDKNRRMKYLVPTTEANQYFSSLGDVMKQSLMPSQATREGVYPPID